MAGYSELYDKKETEKTSVLKALRHEAEALSKACVSIRAEAATLGRTVINSMSPDQQVRAGLTKGELNINKTDGPDEGPLRIE